MLNIWFIKFITMQNVNFPAIILTSGSGRAGPAAAQIFWFGQPWQAEAFPDSSVPEYNHTS